MNKKTKKLTIIGTAIIIVLLVIILIISASSKNNPENNSENNSDTDMTIDYIEQIKGESYEVGYIEMSNKNKQVLFSSYKDFKKYFSKYEDDEESTRNGMMIKYILEKYNEEVFVDKKLAVIYEPVDSSEISVRYKKCKVKNNVANITCKIKSPAELTTNDATGYFVVVELPTEVTSITIEKENAPK